MNRRGFIGWVLALPLLRQCVPAPALAPAAAPAMVITPPQVLQFDVSPWMRWGATLSMPEDLLEDPKAEQLRRAARALGEATR